MFSRILLALVLTLTSVWSLFAADLDLKEADRIGGVNGSRIDFIEEIQGNTNNELPGNYFIDPGDRTGERGIFAAFAKIAYDIKNVGQLLAVVMLIISVLVIVFGSGAEDDLKKWRKTILWTSIGIVAMQAAYAMFVTLYNQDVGEAGGQRLAIQLIENVIQPFVALILLIASFAFIAMSIYAFYLLTTANGDEAQQKEGYQTITAAIFGFLLLKFPPVIVRTIYGTPGCQTSFLSLCTEEVPPDISGTVRIMTNVINYVNGFLAIAAVLMFIWAGWLVLSSRGDSEKITKARNIFIYATIGFVIIVISHALFRFFVIQ